MNILIFGLTVTCSRGNGHATLWRSLIKGMLQRGHTVTFYERAQDRFAASRDLHALGVGANLRLYPDLDTIRAEARRAANDADLAIVSSLCPDSLALCDLVLDSAAQVKAFYDLDTPLTLADAGPPPYIPPRGLRDFDLVLSHTGGLALAQLKSRLGARAVAPLYTSVDAELFNRAPATEQFESVLCYVGTYTPDRQHSLHYLFLGAAERMLSGRFLIGGAGYPDDFPLPQNVGLARHVPATMLPAFFCSSRATLNVTRAAMARYGYCPSGRLFEAAACGAPLLTDIWEGLDTFFEPGRELLRVASAQDVLDALTLSDRELRRIAGAARHRTLDEHTGLNRVGELESICDWVRSMAAHQEVA